MKIQIDDKNWFSNIEKTFKTRPINNPKNIQIIDNSLKIKYPSKKFGSDNSGSSFIIYLPQKTNSLTYSYELMFENNFEFVKGGKLPGCIWGHLKGNPKATVTGGKNDPTGLYGGSNRPMWRRQGVGEDYTYHMDQPEQSGDRFNWNVPFIPNNWHSIRTTVKMNDVGVANGSIESYLDNKLVMLKTNFRFRATNELQIDGFYFSTFYGGDDKSWAPKKDNYIWFRNIEFNI